MKPDPSPLPTDARRDQHLRVRRVTRGVAAAAVLGTAVVGGLAAAGSNESAEAAPPATPTEVTASGLARDVVDSLFDRVLGEDAEAPSSSGRTPVAPSGGS